MEKPDGNWLSNVVEIYYFLFKNKSTINKRMACAGESCFLSGKDQEDYC